MAPSLRIALLMGAATLLVLLPAPALAGFGDSAEVVDLADALPNASNSTQQGDDSATIGRKLLQGSVTYYYIQGGGPKGGYLACESGKKDVLLCYGTTDKKKASKFVAYEYKDMYQLALGAAPSYCLTIFSKPKNGLHLYKCAQSSKAPWYQRWNIYKTFKKGYFTIRTGAKLSDYAFYWPGSNKLFEARTGCNPETNLACQFGVIKA